MVTKRTFIKCTVSYQIDLTFLNSVIAYCRNYFSEFCFCDVF